MARSYKSAKHYLLTLLLPYSEANILLATHPGKFFNKLERLEKIKPNTGRNAYHRAIKSGLIELDVDNVPRLTKKGRRQIAPFTAKKLKGAELMIIFDVHEKTRWKRDQLRYFLREFQFHQIQKSVWATELDCREYLAEEIRRLGLGSQVEVYEARKIKL